MSAKLEAMLAFRAGEREVAPAKCSCCRRRKNDVGEYSDGEGREFCADCGANCTSECWRRNEAKYER